MKKGIIIYKSKYGATKKYAEWLVEKTGFDCHETEKATVAAVADYEIIIVCGGVYAASIGGFSFIKKNFEQLKNKKIIVFCVGASPYDEKVLKDFASHVLTGDLQNLPIFYGRGAWNINKMKLLDRTMSKMLQKSLRNKPLETLENWQRALLSAGEQTCDWTDKKYLSPLLDYLQISC